MRISATDDRHSGTQWNNNNRRICLAKYKSKSRARKLFSCSQRSLAQVREYHPWVVASQQHLGSLSASNEIICIHGAAVEFQ